MFFPLIGHPPGNTETQLGDHMAAQVQPDHNEAQVQEEGLHEEQEEDTAIQALGTNQLRLMSKCIFFVKKIYWNIYIYIYIYIYIRIAALNTMWLLTRGGVRRFLRGRR
jgi:hypothetical protein